MLLTLFNFEGMGFGRKSARSSRVSNKVLSFSFSLLPNYSLYEENRVDYYVLHIALEFSSAPFATFSIISGSTTQPSRHDATKKCKRERDPCADSGVDQSFQIQFDTLDKILQYFINLLVISYSHRHFYFEILGLMGYLVLTF